MKKKSVKYVNVVWRLESGEWRLQLQQSHAAKLASCKLQSANQVPNLQFINGKKFLELRSKKVLLFV